MFRTLALLNLKGIELCYIIFQGSGASTLPRVTAKDLKKKNHKDQGFCLLVLECHDFSINEFF